MCEGTKSGSHNNLLNGFHITFSDNEFISNKFVIENKLLFLEKLPNLRLF